MPMCVTRHSLESNIVGFFKLEFDETLNELLRLLLTTSLKPLHHVMSLRLAPVTH